MPEPYAVRMTGGQRRSYRTRADYIAGRFQASGTANAQRARINRSVGGRIV